MLQYRITARLCIFLMGIMIIICSCTKEEFSGVDAFIGNWETTDQEVISIIRGNAPNEIVLRIFGDWTATVSGRSFSGSINEEYTKYERTAPSAQYPNGQIIDSTRQVKRAEYSGQLERDDFMKMMFHKWEEDLNGDIVFDEGIERLELNRK